MDKPVATTLQIVIPAYRMHTQVFDNMLHGISEEQALFRNGDNTNHVIWMTGNLVNCRYWMANIIGIPDKDPYDDLFKDARALDANADYPSMEELKKEWHKISPVLYQKLLSVTEDELNEPIHFGMNIPYVEENKLNMAGMCLDRESYLLGQVGLMRKLIGLEGVKYDIDKELSY